jgi:NTE family protein
MLGLIEGLGRQGVDLAAADRMVGTSAGARTAAQLATGSVREAAEMHRRGEVPQIRFPVPMGEWIATSMRIIARVPDRQEAARQVANLEPLGERLVSAAERRRAIAAELPTPQWPETPLTIAAVDAGSGDRVEFTADSGVELVDAAAASGALPGIVELPTLSAHRYADGGVHSLFNLDLASGSDIVVLLTPMPLNEFLRGKLDAEMTALGEANVHVITADDESLAAIGPDPLSPEAAQRGLDAGEAQAAREVDPLRAIWETSS